MSCRTSVALALAALTGILLAACGKVSSRPGEARARAQSYMDQQHYSEAVIEYRNAIKQDPNSAELEYKLGQAYTSNQQYQDAFTAFQKALALQPGYEPAQLAVGEYYLVAREYAQATTAAEATLAAHADDPGAVILLANVDAAQGKTAAAATRLEALVKAQPGNVPAHLNLGIVYAVSNRAADAQTEFQRAIDLDPGSVLARNDMANLLATTGNGAGAEAVYRADVEQNPDSADANQAWADFLAGRHRYAEAEPVYKRLVTLRHDSTQAQFALASFYLSAGRSAEAVAIDENLARQAPNFTAAREQWAQIEGQNKNYAQMKQVLDRLLKDQPNDLAALLLRAGEELDQQQPGAALETLAAAQRLNPNVARVAYDQGEAYTQENNPDRAQDSFLQAIALDPQFYDALSATAELMLDRGHSDAALSYAQKMQRLDPGRAEGYYFAGNALANLRQFPDAEAAFTRYAVLAPNSSLGPGHMGYLYLMEKRVPDAEHQFERALQLNPQDNDALAGLVTAYQFGGEAAKAPARIEAQLTAAAAAHAPAAELATMNGQLAKALVEQKQPAAAESVLRTALAQDPHNYNTYVLLGTLYAQENAFPQAREQFAKAVTANPGNGGLWTLLGMLDEQMQKPTEAMNDYNRALAVDPNNGVANNNLAALYATDPRQLDQALLLAQRAKRALPNVADVSDTLGWIYVNQNVLQLAIPLLEQAVNAQPDSSGFRVHLATALFRDGRKAEAAEEATRAVRLDRQLAEQPEIRRMMANN